MNVLPVAASRPETDRCALCPPVFRTQVRFACTYQHRRHPKGNTTFTCFLAASKTERLHCQLRFLQSQDCIYSMFLCLLVLIVPLV